MKGKGKILFAIICFFGFIANTLAACDYETQVRLATEASNVNITYEIRHEIINANTGQIAPEATDEDVEFDSEYTYQDFIYITIMNVTENIYVELIGSDGSTQSIYFSDTNEGTIELDGGLGENIITYTVNIRSNNSNCSSDVLRTFEFVTPKWNPYSALIACEGVNEYYCEPYVTYEINLTEGEIIDRASESKAEETNVPQDEKNSNWWTEWLNNNPWFIPTVIGVIVLAGVATTVIIIKKRRSKVL